MIVEKNCFEIDIEQYNREIEEAEKDIEAGNSYTLQEVKKIARQWGREFGNG